LLPHNKLCIKVHDVVHPGVDAMLGRTKKPCQKAYCHKLSSELLLGDKNSQVKPHGNPTVLKNAMKDEKRTMSLGVSCLSN